MKPITPCFAALYADSSGSPRVPPAGRDGDEPALARPRPFEHRGHRGVGEPPHPFEVDRHHRVPRFARTSSTTAYHRRWRRQPPRPRPAHRSERRRSTTASSSAAWSRTSATTASARPVTTARLTRGAQIVSRSRADTSSAGSSLHRSTSTSRQPSDASRTAVAAPMPRAEPVTIATRSGKEFSTARRPSSRPWRRAAPGPPSADAPDRVTEHAVGRHRSHAR